MPAYIIKPNRDEDFYVRWSTVVDCPTQWGPRASFMEPPERIYRADRHGTSMHADCGSCGGWEDETFILYNQDDLDYDGGCWLLPRANLREFCRRRDEGRPVDDLVTFSSYEDDE